MNLDNFICQNEFLCYMMEVLFEFYINLKEIFK